MATQPPRILCVGLACLDIVNYCDHYPEEDSDMRARDQQWTTGGNALNTCKVLSLIGHSCQLVCTLGEGMETDFAVSEMDRYGIDHSACVHHSHCRLPMSCVVLSASSGSRTIVHHRKLPELTCEEFQKVDFSGFSWIHFEGRHPEVYVNLIARAREYSEKAEQKITISVEIEKTKLQFSSLIPLADILIVSKDISCHLGYETMQEAVTKLRYRARDSAVIVCPWGEEGAAASDQDGKVYKCPAYPPDNLVDTLGAGDTFNAGLIHSLSIGRSLEEALRFACELAGAKCGMPGFDGLQKFKT